MYNLQKQMDDLYSKLHQTEIVKSKWQPISDLILDRLPEQIEELQVTIRINMLHMYLFALFSHKYKHKKVD